MRPASGGVELRNRHLRMFFFCAGLFFVSSALLLPLAAQQTFKKAVPTAADWADIGGRGIAQSSSQNVFFLCGTFFRVLRVAFASRRPADLQKGGPYRRGLGRYRGAWNCAIVISECFFSVRDFFSCPPRCFCLSPPSRPSKRRSLPPRIGPISGGVELRNRHLRMFFFCAGLFFVSSALLLPLAAQQTFKKAVPTAADWADIGGSGIAQSSSQNVFFLCGTFFRVLRVAFASRRPADLQKGGPYRRGLG